MRYDSKYQSDLCHHSKGDATVFRWRVKTIIQGEFKLFFVNHAVTCNVASVQSRVRFYRRDAMLARVFSNVSVCPSVTNRYCVKMKKASAMIFSPSGNPKILFIWRQISSPNSKGFPPNRGLKQGWGGKVQRFSSFKRQYLENGSRYGRSYY